MLQCKTFGEHRRGEELGSFSEETPDPGLSGATWKPQAHPGQMQSDPFAFKFLFALHPFLSPRVQTFFFSWEHTPSATPSSCLCLQTFLSHHFPYLGSKLSPHPIDERVDLAWRLWGGAPLDSPGQMCSVPHTAVWAAHLRSLPASQL